MNISQRAPLLLASLAALGFSNCSDHSIFLRSYGYSEVRPPSQILGPGALVLVLRTKPFEARLVCGPEASLGPRMRYLRSATASGALRGMAGRSFKLDAGVISSLNEQAKYKAVETIEVSLANARIIEISDDDVLRGMSYRSQECREAVRQRVEAGYTITMISSALVADVSYSVALDYSHINHASMADESATMAGLAVALEGEIISSAACEIKATGLVWGIRDDEYLAALSIPYVFEQDFKRGTRHIPIEHVATLDEVEKVEGSGVFNPHPPHTSLAPAHQPP